VAADGLGQETNNTKARMRVDRDEYALKQRLDSLQLLRHNCAVRGPQGVDELSGKVPSRVTLVDHSALLCDRVIDAG